MLEEKQNAAATVGHNQVDPLRTVGRVSTL